MAISRAWPRSPKPVTSVTAWIGVASGGAARFNFVQGFGGVAIQASHGSDGSGEPGFFGAALFQGRGDYACADRLS